MLYSSHWLARRVALACIFVSSGVVALPQQAEIKQGLASIESDANTMTVLQESDRVSIDYQSFDIASHESVIFQQPNVNSVALNRVIGNDVSQIFGLLQSNGKVFLVNPNGILFGENARVDVGSLLATTKNISDDAFMMGNYQFSGEQQTAIVNKGLIEAANDGLIVFVADHINNEGELLAPQGHIELVSANDITLDIAGEAVSIISNQAALDALIENHGLISTDGGMIVLNADAKQALEQTVVNNTGVVKATSVVEKNGEIFIVGNEGDVILDGEISADGFGDTDAGNIQIDANRIALVGEINANGDQLSDGGNIDLRADSNIFLADGSRISADAGTEGDGGRVINFTPGRAFFASDSKLSAKGGAISGDGGFLEVSGLEKVDIFGQVDTSAARGETGTFYIDPYDITISNAANANGAFDAGSPNSWEGSGGGTSSTINSAAITAALAGSDVIINTAIHDGSGPGTGTGTINIDNDIDLNGGNGNTLSLVADDSITLAAGVKIEDKTPGSADAVTVNLTSSNNIIFNNDADIFTTGGNSTVIASNNFQLFGNASIQTGAGTISITANDVDLVGSLNSTSTSDTAISIISDQQIADSGAATVDITATSGGILLDADDGISVDINTDKIDITNSVSGTVTIEGNNDLEVLDVDVYATGAVNILKNNENGNSGGSVTFSGFTSSGNLTVSSDNAITVNGGVSVNVGSSTIDLDADGDIDVLAGSDLTSSAGNITLQADLDGNNVGDIALGNAANVNAGSGVISAQAENIESGQGSFTSTNAGASAITLTAANNIDDLGQPGIMAVAASGGIFLNANGIIDNYTNSQQLAFTNTGVGNNTIDLESTDTTITTLNVAGNLNLLTRNAASDVTINSVTSVGGNVNIEATRDLTLNASLNGAGGNITLEATNGTLTLQNAGISTANDIRLTASDLADDVDRDLSLTADELYLNITNLAADTTFTSSVNTLDANFGGTGNATLNNDSNIQLLDSTFDADANSLTFGPGDVTITSPSLIQVSNNIDLDGSNSATLTLDSAFDLTVDNGISIRDLTTGTVDTTNLVIEADNHITTGATTVIDATDGTIFFNADADNAGNGDAYISSLITNSAATNAIYVHGENIRDVTAGVQDDIQAANGRVELDARRSIGDPALGGPIDILADSVILNSDTNDDIQIDQGNQALTVVSHSGTGPLTINASNNLTLPDAGLNVGTSALTITALDIDDTSGRTLDLTAGALVLTMQNSGGDVVLDTTVTSIDLTNTGTNTTSVNETDALQVTALSSTGDVLFNAGGVLTIPDAGLNMAGLELGLSGSDIVDVSGRDLTLSAQDLYLNYTAAAGDATFSMDVNSLDANYVGSGNFSFTDTSVLTLADSTMDADTDALSFSGGNMTITTSAGNLTVSDSGELDGANSGEILALNAANDLLINSTISDTVGGVDNDIRVDLDAGNDITMASTAFIDAGDGTTFGFIDLNAAGDITLTGLKTLSTSGSAMNIVSTGGSILDAGNVNTDVDARNGRVQLTAATGISDIETHVNNIDLYNLVSGNIVINEQNNLGLFDLASPGDVTLNAGTTISINTDIQLDGDNGATYTFNATNDINVNQNICEGGATCASVDDAVNINLNSTAGSIYVATGQSIITGGGNANISATAAGQEFNMADTTALDAGAGKIVVTADDMRVTNLDSTNTDFDSIQLTSANRINERSGNDVNTAGGVIFNVGAGIYGTVAMVDTPFEVLASEVRVTNTGAGTPVLLNIGSTGTTYEIIDVAGDFFTETVNANSDFVFNDFTNLGGTVDIIATRDIDLNASLNGAAGDITLTASTGNLTLLDAGITTANDLNITANDIVDVSGRDLNLGANNLYLDITNLAGDTNFTTSVNTLDANFSGTGNVVVSNDADIQLLDSAHDANSRSLTFDSGNVTVVSTGDINVSSDIDLDGANGTQLTLDAGTDLVFDMNVFVQDFATGSADAVTIDFQAGSNFVLDEDSDIVSTGGDITIQATNAFQKLRRSQIDAGSGLIDIQGNSVELRGNTISTNASASAIQVTSGTTIVDGLDGTGMTDLEATAGGVVLSAATGIEVDTDTTSLAVTNSTSGVVTIQEADAITVTDINAAGNFSLSSTGGNDITLDQITNVNDLTFTTAGNVRFDTNNSFAAAGDMTLDAANIVNDAGGPDLNLSSGGTLTLPDAVSVLGTSLNLTANDIVDLTGRDLDITAAGLYLDISSLTADTNFATSMNTLDANFGGTGNVVINNDMALQLLDTTNDANSSALTMGAGNVTITTAGGGDLVVDSLIDLDGANGNALTLNAANDLQITSNKDIVDSATGTADAVDINLIAGNDVFVQINNEVFSYGGDITINAGGQFDTRNASTYNSGTGNISVNANDVSLVSALRSDSVDSNAISIISADQIVDGGGAFVDVAATNGGAVLQAVNGINLDTDVTELDITNTTSGDVIIDEENSVDLTSLRFAGGDATITTQNTGDLSTSGTIDINGANGQALNLIAANDLIFNTGGEIRDSDTGTVDIVALNLTAGNNMTLAASSDLESYGGNIVLGATGDYTSNAGADVRSGTGTINLSANDVTLIGSLRSDSTSASAITVTSLDSITDGGANNIDISASSGGADLNAINGIDVDLEVANLDLTNATMGNVILEGTGNLDITNLAASALSNVSILKNNENGNSGGDVTLSGYANSGDLTITSDGTVTFPDSGLNAGTNDLTIEANDIQDVSGRTLDFTVAQLSLDLANPANDLTLNTNVDNFQAHFGTVADLTVNESDALVLSDVAGLGSAIDLADGNFILNSGALTVDSDVTVQQGDIQFITNGDAQINADITASDAVSDGLREGLIDIGVDNGSLTVGGTGPVSIISNNTADQTANGGVTSTLSDQVGISFKQLDTSNSSHTFTFGNGVGNDVLVQAIGGDVDIDSVNSVAAGAGAARPLIFNSDLTLESYNNAGDPSSGAADLSGLTDNGATVNILSGRLARFNPSEIVVAPAPAPAPAPAEPPVEDIVSEIVDQVEDVNDPTQDPLETEDPVIAKQVESDSTQVSNTFQRAFGSCSEAERANNSGNCKVDDVLVKFLSAFVIGGALPKVGN